MDELCHASAANRPESQSQLSVSRISVDSTIEALGSRSVAYSPQPQRWSGIGIGTGLSSFLSVISEMQENAAAMQAGNSGIVRADTTRQTAPNKLQRTRR
jgi:hypothetical protein